MENKINLVELLKDCPKGIELDCTVYNNVTLEYVCNSSTLPICIRIQDRGTMFLSKYGQFHDEPYCKCIIFPKGKTTWEGFIPPCKFKDGDIISDSLGTCIFKGEGEFEGTVNYYCGISNDYFRVKDDKRNPSGHYGCIVDYRLSTEEEKQKLFDAIKANGYKWNTETKTLEKLVEPRFYAGVWVVFNNHPEKGSIYQIKNTHNYEYTLQHILGGSITIPFSRADMLRLWTIDDAKDGDILFHSDSASNGIFIFKEILQSGTIQKVICYCDYDSEDGFCLGENHTCCWTDSKILHPATKEQRDFLFQKIKESGYKWNSDNKTLEELIEPEFKVGDKIKLKSGDVFGIITQISDCFYTIKCKNHTHYWPIQKQEDWELINEPKFKVGDRIKSKNFIEERTIKTCEEDGYWTTVDTWIRICDQDNWELVPKFDINTLVPFESRVLVRDTDHYEWEGAVFGRYDGNSFFTIGGIDWKYCIPYKGNEYLFGKTDDCSDFYKNW